MSNRLKYPFASEEVIARALRANAVTPVKSYAFRVGGGVLDNFPVISHRFHFVDISAAIVDANKTKAKGSCSKLEKEFNELAALWKRETSFLSSPGAKVTHPAYQRIMAMGEIALPWIMADLRKQPGHWFYALRFIAGKDVAAEAGAKTFSEAREAWLHWGNERDNTFKAQGLFLGSIIL